MVDRIFCIDIQDLFHRKSHVRGVATDGVLVEKSFKQLDPKRFHIYWVHVWVSQGVAAMLFRSKEPTYTM